MFQNRSALDRSSAHGVALDCLAAGVRAAHPRRVVPDALALDGDRLTVGDRTVDLAAADRVLVLGGGNAAGTAVAALVDLLGDRIDGGLVVTDAPEEAGPVVMRSGDHPVPTKRNVRATADLLALAREAGPEDLVIAVVTGGGSALLAAPAGDLSLSDLRETTEALLASGAPIDAVNTVRRALSTVKGGGLARATAPADVVALVLSDVVGDDPATVASGPTVPADTGPAGARAVLDRHGVTVPAAVEAHLDEAARSDPPAVVPEGVTTHVVGGAGVAVDAAAAAAREAGYTPLVLSTRTRGPARAAATTHVAVAEEAAATGRPVESPAVLLSAGEVTVADPGPGAGGPNTTVGVGAALDLATSPGPAEDLFVGSLDTDGVDGASDAAGALVDADTVDDPDAAREALAAGDTASYLDARDALVRTGPTGTNVNDLRAVVVRASPGPQG